MRRCEWLALLPFHIRHDDMKRAAVEKVRTVRTWSRHFRTHRLPIRCECEFQVGRFRKAQRIGGCGKARCYLCHFEKLSGIPKVQELRGAATLREGLTEAAPISRSTRTPAGGPSAPPGGRFVSRQPHRSATLTHASELPACLYRSEQGA